MFGLNSIKTFTAVATIAALASLGTNSAAQAATAGTYCYDTVVTGATPATTCAAQLTLSTVATGVQFDLKNTDTGDPRAWIDYLLFNYSGNTSGLGITDFTDSWTIVQSIGTTTNAGLDFNIKDNVNPNGSKNGLLVGDTTSWIVTGAVLADIMVVDPNSLLHIGGLNGGKSTKLTTSGLSPVPLPAAGLLLMGALGGLGLAKRRRKAA